MPAPAARQDIRYECVAADYGTALERLARAYEADPDKRRDLLQEIHVALWRSLQVFDERCSLRTWVYRVAHNVATSQILRRRTNVPTLVTLDELAATLSENDAEEALDRRMALERLAALIRTLKPLDRQVILLYLEDLEAASIAEIVGLAPGNVATKIHRIKQILARRFREGARHGA